MPAQYEKIKASELARGASKETAERIAAATYNKHRGSKPPVTRNSDSPSASKKPLGEAF